MSPDFGLRSQDSVSRIAVSIADECCNRCRYCACGLSGKFADKKTVMLILRRGRSFAISHVEFTGGEPTLHPELPWFVAAAKAMGYDTLGVSSNGRRLAYPSYAKTLIRAGISYVMISVPAADKKTYAKISGVRAAALMETLTGLKNAVDSGTIEVGASVPVTADNSDSLGKIIRMLDGFGLSFITLSRPLPGFPDGVSSYGLLSRDRFIEAIRNIRKGLSAVRTRVFVEDFSGDLGCLPGENVIGELQRNKYLYADAVSKKQFLMPDAVLAAEPPASKKNGVYGNFRAAIDLQYGPSDFTCGFDFRAIQGKPYHLLADKRPDFDFNSPVLKRFLSIVNRQRTIDIWGRDRADKFPKLKGLVELCRRSGFKNVRLWTAGFGLDSDARLDRLRSFGVTALELPAYGASPEVCDAVTGVKGSYRKLCGLMARLAKRADFEVSFHSVALKRNVRELPAIARAINGYSKSWKFAVWHYYPDYQSREGGEKYLAELPSYDDVIKTFRGCQAAGEVEFVLFPNCVVKRLHLGFNGAKFFKQDPVARLLVYRDGLFHFSKIDSAGEFGRKKASPCTVCADRDPCPGVFSDYLDKYGHKSIG